MEKSNKDLLEELENIKPNHILVLLWDEFPNIREMLRRLEHWAEHYAWTNSDLGRKRRTRIWDKISFLSWKLRNKF